MSVQDHTDGEHGSALLYIDRGTNISALGKQFHITAHSNRYVDMEGFANVLCKTNVQIGNGLTVVENDMGQ